jgi:hypothetical protein
MGADIKIPKLECRSNAKLLAELTGGILPISADQVVQDSVKNIIITNAVTCQVESVFHRGLKIQAKVQAPAAL